MIGKKGEDVDRLRRDLTEMMGVPVHVNIEEVRKPELDAKLVDPGSRGVIASRHFRVSQPLTDTAVPAVVDGLSSAADTLAQQLLDWSRATLRQDQAQ